MPGRTELLGLKKSGERFAGADEAEASAVNKDFGRARTRVVVGGEDEAISASSPDDQ